MPLSNEHLAAAVAAAAELAKTGGNFMYTTGLSRRETAAPMVFPMTIPQSPSPVLVSHGSDDDADDCKGEEDAERRMARSRERNREHARKTRLRKKAQLEALQSKVKGLQAESKVLKQSLEECSIASILVGLSSGSHDATIQSLVKIASATEEKEVLKIVGGKRKRFASPTESIERTAQPLKISIDGKTALIGGGRTHINWKTGVYSDDNGSQKQLSQEQLESLRRERNRMHAKMTRDRKKSFIATIEKTIEDLETNNNRMKEALAEVIQTHFKANTSVLDLKRPETPDRGTADACNENQFFQNNTASPITPETSRGVLDEIPPVTPETTYRDAPNDYVPPLDEFGVAPLAKKVRHGFSFT